MTLAPSFAQSPPGAADPGHWACDHIPLAGLIRRAWALQEFQLAGPSWMEQEYFATPPRVCPRVALGDDGYPGIPPGLAVSMLGKPVVTHTGLKGKYTFQVSWIYDGPGADRSQLPPAANPSGPTIFRAIQEQLGLRLEPKRVAVDFLTVESALRTPLEN